MKLVMLITMVTQKSWQKTIMTFSFSNWLRLQKMVILGGIPDFDIFFQIPIVVVRSTFLMSRKNDELMTMRGFFFSRKKNSDKLVKHDKMMCKR